MKTQTSKSKTSQGIGDKSTGSSEHTHIRLTKKSYGDLDALRKQFIEEFDRFYSFDATVRELVCFWETEHK